MASRLCGFEQECVDFFMNPIEVRAKCDIPKGKLQLAPITDMNKLAIKSMTSWAIATGTRGHRNFYLEQPTRPRGDSVDEWPKQFIAAAFWSVVELQDNVNVNMKLSKLKVNCYTFPIWENSKSLEAGQKLIGLDTLSTSKKART